MSKDIEHLKYLDEILSYLAQQDNATSNVRNLVIFILAKQKIVPDLELLKDAVYNNSSMKFQKTRTYQESKLNSAIIYLKDEGYINIVGNAVSLTFKGHLKLDTTFKKEKNDSVLNRWLIVTTILTSWGLLIFTALNSSKCSDVPDKNDNKCYMNSQPQQEQKSSLSIGIESIKKIFDRPEDRPE